MESMKSYQPPHIIQKNVMYNQNACIGKVFSIAPSQIQRITSRY